LGRGNPKKLVKAHENEELGKGPRKPRESKWAEDARAEANGTLEPTSNVIKELIVILSHWEKNKWQVQKGPVGLGQIKSQ